MARIDKNSIFALYKYRCTIMDTGFSRSEDVVGQVFRALREKNATFSSAESCTGGNIAHLITLVPGSSEVFVGSVVSYATRVKTDLLGVPAVTIEKDGVVSCATASAMASGVRNLLATDYAVATTGVAGPGGGTEQNPVGTVCIAAASSDRTVSKRLVFGNDRAENINSATYEAYRMLLEMINEKTQQRT